MKSKKLSFFFLIFSVFIFNIVLYGLFFRLDITAEQPWRQTDTQAEITAYERGTTDFIRPTVNAPRTQWGPGIIEIPLPVFPYIAAKLSSLIKPIVTPYLTDSSNELITAPFGMKLSHYATEKQTIGSHVIYAVHFTLHPTFEYRIASLINPYIYKFLHVYLVAKKPAVQKQCMGLTMMDKMVADMNPNSPHTPTEYCYSTQSTPITYIPILVGKNVIKFTFPRGAAPEKLSDTIRLISDSKFATRQLFSGRVVNLITVSLIAIILAVAFFSAGVFRWIAAFTISTMPIFGLFATFIHEEIVAFLFVSLFLLVVMKKDLRWQWVILGAIFLSIATAIRPYYIMYSLVLAGFAFYFEKPKVVFRRPVYYIAAFISLLPSLCWYSWTQYMVAHGADTIGIFSNRVFFSSLLNWDKWKSFGSFFVNTHFGWPILIIFILIYITYIIFRLKKRISFNPKLDIFLLVGLLISLVIFPLIFDSASIHDYYSFPDTSYLIIAALICFYRIIDVVSIPPLRKKLLSVFIIIVMLMGIKSALFRFAWNVDKTYDPLDFAVLGGLTGQLFSQNEKVVLLDAGGPEVYGMSNRDGRRDAGFYTAYPFKGVNDFEHYLTRFYGPVSTYQGIASCYTMLHRVENFTIFKKFVHQHTHNLKNIVYVLGTYPQCQIMVFNHDK